MLLNLLDKAATKQGLIKHVDNVRGDHKPEREDQRNFHIVVSPYDALPDRPLTGERSLIYKRMRRRILL